MNKIAIIIKKCPKLSQLNYGHTCDVIEELKGKTCIRPHGYEEYGSITVENKYLYISE